MIQKTLKIVNTLGLHARASAKLTKLACQYKSNIWITYNQHRVNAKSIIGVMMLAVAKNNVILLEIDGDDEQDCLHALQTLIQNYFGEAI